MRTVRRSRIAVAGKAKGSGKVEMLASLHHLYVFHKTVLLRPAGQEHQPIVRLAEYTAGRTMLGRRATVFVCQNYVRNAPTTGACRHIMGY